MITHEKLKKLIPHQASHLAAMVHMPAGNPRAAVLVAHGLYSSMASRKLTALCQALALAGYVALQFDHSGCGESPGEERLTTLTSRRDEVLSASRFLAVEARGLPQAFVGSSLGGAAVILAADLMPPACLATWSAPTDMAELHARLLKADPPPDLPEMADDITRHDLAGALARSERLLVIHGEKDEVVPLHQARNGYALAHEPKGLLILPGADHQLTNPNDQAVARARTLDWIDRFTG